MRLRRLNNIIHRDVGYFFAGTTIVYAISGLAVNHVRDWNPNFIITRQPIQVASPVERDSVTREWVMDVLSKLDEQDHYRSHDFPTEKKVKIYLDDGSVFIQLANGKGEYEVVKRRPFLYRLNYLHLSPKQAWLFFSDLFAVSLIAIVVTGLFVLKGKKGITGRGAVLAGMGVIVPLVFLLVI